MRIKATSDTHGFLEMVEKDLFTWTRGGTPDIVVIAGDVAPCIYGLNEYEYIVDEFFPIIAKHSDVKVVFVPGNHDRFTKLWDEKYAGCAPKNLVYLRDMGTEIDGVSFYGYPWVPYINGRWQWECKNQKEEWTKVESLPTKVDVLVCHTPPLIPKSKVDVSMELQMHKERHYGSAALYERIKEIKPRLVICGHIHSGDHRVAKIGRGTMLYNVSCVNERYQVTYSPTEILIPTEK